MRESLKELIKELDNLSSSRESLSRKDLPKEEKIELEKRLKEERLELENKILKCLENPKNKVLSKNRKPIIK